MAGVCGSGTGGVGVGGRGPGSIRGEIRARFDFDPQSEWRGPTHAAHTGRTRAGSDLLERVKHELDAAAAATCVAIAIVRRRPARRRRSRRRAWGQEEQQQREHEREQHHPPRHRSRRGSPQHRRLRWLGVGSDPCFGGLCGRLEWRWLACV